MGDNNNKKTLIIVIAALVVIGVLSVVAFVSLKSTLSKINGTKEPVTDATTDNTNDSEIYVNKVLLNSDILDINVDKVGYSDNGISIKLKVNNKNTDIIGIGVSDTYLNNNKTSDIILNGSAQTGESEVICEVNSTDISNTVAKFKVTVFDSSTSNNYISNEVIIMINNEVVTVFNTDKLNKKEEVSMGGNEQPTDTPDTTEPSTEIHDTTEPSTEIPDTTEPSVEPSTEVDNTPEPNIEPSVDSGAEQSGTTPSNTTEPITETPSNIEDRDIEEVAKNAMNIGTEETGWFYLPEKYTLTDDGFFTSSYGYKATVGRVIDRDAEEVKRILYATYHEEGAVNMAVEELYNDVMTDSIWDEEDNLRYYKYVYKEYLMKATKDGYTAFMFISSIPTTNDTQLATLLIPTDNYDPEKLQYYISDILDLKSYYGIYKEFQE